MSQDLVNFLNKYAEILNTNEVEAAGKESRDVEMGRDTVRLHLSLNRGELQKELTDLIANSSAKKLLDGKSHAREEIQSWFSRFSNENAMKLMAVATALNITKMTSPYADSERALRYSYANKTSVQALPEHVISASKPTEKKQASTLAIETPALEVTGNGKELHNTVANEPSLVKGA